MGVGTGLYMCDVVKKLTFAVSSPDEFLLRNSTISETFYILNLIAKLSPILLLYL